MKSRRALLYISRIFVYVLTFGFLKKDFCSEFFLIQHLETLPNLRWRLRESERINRNSNIMLFFPPLITPSLKFPLSCHIYLSNWITNYCLVPVSQPNRTIEDLKIQKSKRSFRIWQASVKSIIKNSSYLKELKNVLSIVSENESRQ